MNVGKCTGVSFKSKYFIKPTQLDDRREAVKNEDFRIEPYGDGFLYLTGQDRNDFAIIADHFGQRPGYLPEYLPHFNKELLKHFAINAPVLDFSYVKS